ncbi:MAG: dihydrolipoamide acetyltransferase family protein [Sedimentisphaerales bacterium]|jgi:pyruvate dehydrogenase E2 component (dihydrolipoamide acetyltransferase)
MMAKEIRLPKFGDTMEEGTVVDCKVAPGDHVKSGDVLFEIETDKASVELESPADGYVKQVLVTVGQNYRVGTPLLILGEKDEQLSDDYLRSLKNPAWVSPATQKKPQSIPLPVSKPVARRGKQIPVSRFHKLTAEKMLRSKQEIPCFYLTVRADITELVAYREKLNKTASVKVAYNDFLIKAVAMGLEKFPIMTGQLDGDSIRLAESIGVGLAIETQEGLVAPIVKDANKKTLVEIAHYSQQLIDKAQSNQLMPEDLEGGCITISNLGSLGIDSFIPIVVPGQCSIMGIGRIKDACVPDVDSTPDKGIRGRASSPQADHLNIRKVVTLTLSVDHKVANGAYAAQFLDFVKKTLEDPAILK